MKRDIIDRRIVGRVTHSRCIYKLLPKSRMARRAHVRYEGTNENGRDGVYKVKEGLVEEVGGKEGFWGKVIAIRCARRIEARRRPSGSDSVPYKLIAPLPELLAHTCPQKLPATYKCLGRSPAPPGIILAERKKREAQEVPRPRCCRAQPSRVSDPLDNGPSLKAPTFHRYDTTEYEAPRSRTRYRSRFMRNRDGEDSDGDTRATVRFNAPQEPSALRERERVLDTEDASRGPLSGIFRLTDSPRVMKKLNDCERADKRKKDESAQPQHQKAQVRQPLLLAGPPSPSVALRRPPTPNSSHPHP
jgi:hypothetical protein